MRIVLDTNIVVSALLWGGTPKQLLHAAANGKIVLATSPVLLAELREVLTRSHLAPRLEAKRQTVDQAIAEYAQLATTVAPTRIPRAVPTDPDDDHVIAAAIVAHANFIVSGDRDLLELGSFQNIRILRAAQAVAEIEALR